MKPEPKSPAPRATKSGTFDEVASDYRRAVDESVQFSGDNSDVFATIKAELTRDELGGLSRPDILDFGCGVGLSTRALAAAIPHAGRIVGVDPSRESIATAREELRDIANITFVDQPEPVLPFESGTFDVVFTACVFHHIDRSDHVRWLGELRRVLRDGGMALMFEHNPLNPLTRRVVRSCAFDEGAVLLSPSYSRQIFAKAGLKPGPARFYYFFPRALSALRVLEPGLRRVPLGAQYYVRADRVPIVR